MNKTLEVIRFEVLRSLKKPGFWIAAILIPIAFGAYILLAGAVGYNTNEAINNATDTSESKLGLLDQSSYVKQTKITNADGKEQNFELFEEKDAGIAAVKDRSIDIFYYLAPDFDETKKVEIYTKPESKSIISDYSGPIRMLLNTTALTNVSMLDYAVITNAVDYKTTEYDVKDNHVVDEGERIKQIAGPAIALACFYILIVVLGNRLTAAMVEEKENRISELILTSVKPSQLIFGKIVSLMIAGIIQLIILIVPVLVLYKIAQTQNILPEYIKLGFDIISILQYLLFLIVSYFVFTALCVFIGVISPTAKEANSYSSFVIILVILPIFFINTFMGEPGVMGYVLSYFPPSAPIAILLRGVFGNLAPWEYWISLAELAIFGALIVKLDSHIFNRNAIEFTSKVSLKNLLNGPRKTWKK